MVNSASQAIAEFKSQRLGGLLSGTSSTVDPPSMIGSSLGDSFTSRMARSAPKKSSTAFLDSIRQSGQRQHQAALQGIQARQARQFQGYANRLGPSSKGYGINPPKGGNTGAGGPRGAYGLTVPAANSFGQLNSAYSRAFGGGLTVNDGGRSNADQWAAYNRMLYQGGPKAAYPGTSLHESGTAVDLGGPIQNTGSAQHAWLRQNAAQFGWYWVGQNFGEPWHWEYHP